MQTEFALNKTLLYYQSTFGSNLLITLFFNNISINNY